MAQGWDRAGMSEGGARDLGCVQQLGAGLGWVRVGLGPWGRV